MVIAGNIIRVDKSSGSKACETGWYVVVVRVVMYPNADPCRNFSPALQHGVLRGDRASDVAVLTNGAFSVLGAPLGPKINTPEIRASGRGWGWESPHPAVPPLLPPPAGSPSRNSDGVSPTPLRQHNRLTP